MKNEKLPKTTITKEATIFPFTSLSHSPPPPPKKSRQILTLKVSAQYID